MTIRILFSLPIWLLYSAVANVLDLIGLVLLLPLSLAKAWEWRHSTVWPGGFKDRVLVSAWKGGWLTWLWGNEEDGVLGAQWWQMRNEGKPLWWIAYRWSALRNPTNNLRFIPVINPVIEPARIRSIREGRWIFTWQGIYSGFMWFPVIGGKTWRFWIGWKLKPEDAQGVPDDDMRKPRCGFAMQLKRVG